MPMQPRPRAEIGIFDGPSVRCWRVIRERYRPVPSGAMAEGWAWQEHYILVGVLDLTTFSILFAATAGSQCSQKRITFQPQRFRVASVSRSRSMFVVSLLRHQRALAFGHVP